MTDQNREISPNEFLEEVEAFLAQTGMGETYFGRVSVGNSELVNRLRAGGRCWPETQRKARDFMIARAPDLYKNSGQMRNASEFGEAAS